MMPTATARSARLLIAPRRRRLSLAARASHRAADEELASRWAWQAAESSRGMNYSLTAQHVYAVAAADRNGVAERGM